MKTNFALELTYINDEVAHTNVYTEEQKEKAKADFVKIRKVYPTFPVHMLGKLGDQIINVSKGDDYDFEDLPLTMDVKLDTGSEITYLCRKHYRGKFIVNVFTKNGPRYRGCVVLRTVRRTYEQLMNQRNEGNFERHRFFEDVVVKEI